MNLIEKLLSVTYERELELDDLIERSNSDNLWFFKDTKNLNVELQIACLKHRERDRQIEELRNSLH